MSNSSGRSVSSVSLACKKLTAGPRIMCERRGGWGYHPLHKLHPEREGMEAWRHEWHKSKLWILLNDPDTGDPDTVAGARFREMLGVPRVMFDEW